MSAYKNISWNQLSMEVPKSWHPAVILQEYILFEEDYQPVVELRWQKVKGKLSVKKIISRLEKAQPGTSYAPWDLPSALVKELSPLKLQGMSWEHGDTSGKTLLLYCSHCTKTTLAKFHNKRVADHPVHHRFLLSLRDHQDGPTVDWKIFDMQARLPAASALVSHEFLPGRFTLNFNLDQQRITLMRFKPALELLRNVDLEEFGQSMAAGASLVKTDNQGVARWEKQGSFGSRLLAKLRRSHSDSCLQLTHLPEQNVLLAVQITANSPIQPALMQELCDHLKPGQQIWD